MSFCFSNSPYSDAKSIVRDFGGSTGLVDAELSFFDRHPLPGVHWTVSLTNGPAELVLVENPNGSWEFGVVYSKNSIPHSVGPVRDFHLLTILGVRMLLERFGAAGVARRIITRSFEDDDDYHVEDDEDHPRIEPIPHRVVVKKPMLPVWYARQIGNEEMTKMAELNEFLENVGPEPDWFSPSSPRSRGFSTQYEVPLFDPVFIPFTWINSAPPGPPPPDGFPEGALGAWRPESVSAVEPRAAFHPSRSVWDDEDDEDDEDDLDAEETPSPSPPKRQKSSEGSE